MKRRRFLSFASLLAVAVATGGARAAEVGDRVEWRDLQLLDGTTLPASRLAGRVVVVEFWASWCPFCKRQNPLVEALHREHGGRGLEVLTFTIDKDLAKARAYLAENGYTFRAAAADAETLRRFDLRKGLPVLFVVDGTGRVIRRESGEMFEEDVRALASHAVR
jgi:thiol-disulfide isomerase/thioredoxin